MDKQERLAAYERMHQNVIDRLQTTTDKMDEFKIQGKVKSVTYKQLMADKLTFQKMISMYEIYGIE
ncbi:MAG: hypothetical protein PHE02_12195 [Lachnospiraceae bacterium]|nr:hypothetical protein [Lachnospiraceae bacterium]